MTTETIPLFPNLKASGEEIEEALKNREQADYQCYLFLQNNRDLLITALSYLEKEYEYDREEVDAARQELKDCINNRVELNDKFLNLVTGN